MLQLYTPKTAASTRHIPYGFRIKIWFDNGFVAHRDYTLLRIIG